MTARLLALATLSAACATGCYAEFDVPRCDSVDDCPSGYSVCYESYCLEMPRAGVEKAPLPAADTTQPAVDATVDSSVPDVQSPDATTCTPAADDCCDLTLANRTLDPDCTAWVGPRPPATWASRPIIDTERELYHLTYGATTGETTLFTATLGGTQEPRHHILAKEDARCPVLLEGGDVIVVGPDHVWRVPPEGDAHKWVADHPFKKGPDATPPCPAISQGRILLVAGDSVAALDTETHSKLWTWTEPDGAQLLSPAARGSTVVVVTENGVLWRLDDVGKDEPEAHSTDLSATITSGPIAGPGADLLALGTTKLGKPALLRAAIEIRALAERDALLLDVAPLPGAEPVVTPTGEVWVLHDDHRARFYPSVEPSVHATAESPPGLEVYAMSLLSDGSLLLSTHSGVVAINMKDELPLWRYELPPLEPLPALPLPGARLLVIGAQTLYELRTDGAPLADGPWSTQRRDLAASAARP